ncbi:MAG TPA: CBS domain-containing protein [Pyrinomonadaceae bacterium]|jgi:CBS domain-containing protein|nr:CBS domain-containing protein [Pyrinomonadaceae bacterium]
MARYRNEMDDDRDYYAREENLRREDFGRNYDDRYRSRRQFDNERRPDYSRGQFGERADYNYDEPRYANYGGGERWREENRRSSLYEGRDDLSSNTWRDRDNQYAGERSRLRCRDVMTRDLAIATRDTTLPEIALMMKQEDTGVIPVVEYDMQRGNGGTEAKVNERKYEGRNYTRGKLIGLITDRDIVVRAVADNKDCASVRAEDIMSVDIHTARPNDRIVDVIRKMGDKQVRRIPVTNDNGYLVGMISMADVAIETRQDRELADAIEDISKGTSFWNRIFG